MMESKMAKSTAQKLEEVRTILRRPYARVIYPEDDGSYYGDIIEFPGCFAAGATAADTLRNLEEVAEGWLSVEIEKGHAIPQPMGTNEYSGKLVLRIPRALHRKAAWAAERDGVSLNQFIATALAENVGERRATPNTTVSLITIAQTKIIPWSGMSSLTSNVISAFTGEIMSVGKHA
jgi:antitoxin HicB